MLCQTNARWLTNLYLWVAFLSVVTLWLEPAFQHVILVGGFAASGWLFDKVHKKLLQHGMNVIRPQNHVCVPSSLEINLVLTSYSAIRPFLMAPCHSITTALQALESLSLPTELLCTFPSILLLQITNKDPKMYLLIFLGAGASRVASLSSCQRLVYFPSRLFTVEQMCPCRTRKFRRSRNSDVPIIGQSNPRMRSKELLFP